MRIRRAKTASDTEPAERRLLELYNNDTSGFLCYLPAMKRACVFFAVLNMALPIAVAQTVLPKPEVSQQPMSVDEAAIRQIS